MNAIEQINRLQRIDQFIRTESTGCPKDFAAKLNISASTLFELLNYLKQLGAEIYYNHDKLSYTYVVPVKLIFKLEKQELSKVSGGKMNHSEKIGALFINLVLN